MSAFNLVRSETICPACGQRGVFEVHFKYGRTWQLSYKLGDALTWGGNDIGLPSARKVAVEAIGEKCPSCGHDMLEFDLIVENNVLKELIGVGVSRESESDVGYRVLEE